MATAIFYGSSHFRRFQDYLPETTQLEFFVKGGRRISTAMEDQDTRRFLREVRHRALDGTLDVIFIHLGDNDVRRRMLDTRLGSESTTYAERLHRATVRIVDDIQIFTTKVRQQLPPSSKTEIVVVDLWPRTPGTNDDHYRQVQLLVNSRLHHIPGVKIARISKKLKKKTNLQGVHLANSGMAIVRRELNQMYPRLRL